MKFEDFFHKATEYKLNSGKTKNFDPYSYQTKLAKQDVWPTLLEIPTGCGKTESAIIAWLWQRRYKEKNKPPRRLVYCVPMRTLVDQTYERVNNWIKHLEIKDVTISVLMGGRIENEWIEEPEKDAIIIGTQDMLLSRALNRGYGLRPSRWPIEFGLINNDCLWIIDEVQLMDNGLATSLQLQAFREDMKTFGNSHTMWMSATINKGQMSTVDYKSDRHDHFQEKIPELEKITTAKKALKSLDVKLDESIYNVNDIEKITKLHQNKPMLIIVNNVKRAQELFKEIEKIKEKNCMLIHSRFRPHERRDLNKKLADIKQDDDIIVVSTQAVEAGVDVSSHILITELAPIASMVQRFGRCNRRGEYDDSAVYWIDLNIEKNSYPYSPDDLEASKQWLKDQKSASSADLKYNETEKMHDMVIRKSDIIGLFDTSPDMSGNYLDVSRFIRHQNNLVDVRVYWKSISDKPKKLDRIAYHDEICTVSITDLRQFLKKSNNNAWFYNYMNKEYNPEECWEKVYEKDIMPGQTLLLNSEYGGYSQKYGLDITEKANVKEIQHENNPENKNIEGKDITIKDHSMNVVNKAKNIVSELDLTNEIKDIIIEAALYHDLGKSHPVFQHTLRHDKSTDQLLAKSSHKGKSHSRKNFRHEVASALAYLNIKHPKSDKKTDLIAYLIASHHGKARLALRPVVISKVNADSKYLLGFPIDTVEKLPEVDLGSITIPETEIDISIAKIGKRDDTSSWLSKMLALRDSKEYGPFRLAYLEAVLRAADITASKEEENGV